MSGSRSLVTSSTTFLLLLSRAQTRFLEILQLTPTTQGSQEDSTEDHVRWKPGTEAIL